MDIRVAIDFRRRGLKYLHLEALGETKHVDGADDVGLGRLCRVKLVMDGGRGTSEIENLVDLDKERPGHVVAHEFHPAIVEKMRDVLPRTRKEVVDTDDLGAAIEQPFA
jgi:hypothetical protein